LSAWRRGGDNTQGATCRRASPWNPCGAQLSKAFNNKLAQTTIPADLSSLNNGSPRRPVSGRGLPLLVSHFIAEMGLGSFGEVSETNKAY